MEQKILDLLKDEFPDIDFETSADLVDDGVLDSLSLTEVITLLSMEFDIEIPYEEIIEDNFNSVVAMARLVERLQ